MKAIWNNKVIAESEDAIKIEQHYYFPVESVNMNLLKKNNQAATCSVKGDGCYYDLEVDGKVIKNAASSFSHPAEGAEQIKNLIGFENNIEIKE